WFVGPQSCFVYDRRGNLMVDFLGRYENLQTDFQEICRRLDLPFRTLPHVNRSKGPKFSLREIWKRLRAFYSGERGFRSYQDYYDDESRKLVGELYAKDIERF